MATVAPSSVNQADIADLKASQRRRARALRAAMPAAERARASERLREHLGRWLTEREPGIVAGFWPLGGEVDLKPLLRAWHDRGGIALLPRVEDEAQPLRFLRWTPSTTLELSAFAVEEPPANAPEYVPDIVLVPFLLVDGQGHRLGYGGGYYDRTLARLANATAVGVGFEAQRVDCLPAAPHDQRLTHLATETGVVRLPLGSKS